MVVAAANLVTKHGIDRLDVDTDYLDDNFLHDGRKRRKHDDDIMSMTAGDADAEGMLKNAYEESIIDESSTDEEEEARQMNMAASAVALQQRARNSAGEFGFIKIYFRALLNPNSCRIPYKYKTQFNSYPLYYQN